MEIQIKKANKRVLHKAQIMFLKDLILTKDQSLQHLNQGLEQVLLGGNSDQVLLAIQVDQVLLAEWSIKARLGNKIPVFVSNLVSK